MVASAFNINDLESSTSSNVDFKRLFFYLSHMWIARVLKAFHATYLMRIEVAAVNQKLKLKLAERIVYIVAIDSSKDKTKKDLTELIDIFNKEIENFSFAHNELQRMFEFKDYKNLGDWDTANTLLAQIIEADYKLLRMFKKMNKKISIPTSELAKDTVKHSRSALSKIINGH